MLDDTPSLKRISSYLSLDYELDDKDFPDYSFIESLLAQDFREIYGLLTQENKRTFWKNTIRQIHLKSDYTIDCVDFI